MLEKTEEEVEWSERRAEVGVELAKLADEYGMDAVIAECSDFVASQTKNDRKEQFIEKQTE